MLNMADMLSMKWCKKRVILVNLEKCCTINQYSSIFFAKPGFDTAEYKSTKIWDPRATIWLELAWISHLHLRQTGALAVYYFSYGLRMQSIDGNALTLLHAALSGAASVHLRLLSAETVCSFLYLLSCCEALTGNLKKTRITER